MPQSSAVIDTGSDMVFLGTSDMESEVDSDTDSDIKADKLNSLTSDSDTLPCRIDCLFVLEYSIKFNQSGATEGAHNQGCVPSRK